MFVVTGATGFIGSAMVWELNRRGRNDVLISDLVPPEQRGAMLNALRFEEFIPADALLSRLAQHRNVSAVFHMGACSSTTEMDVEYLRRVNTDYTRHLFQLCQERGWPLLYASSGAVYGSGEQGFSDLPPSARFKPLNPYGWSKLHFDDWLERQPPAQRTYGLRFFNVYGPNEYHKGEMASVVYKAFQQIRETGRLKLFRSHNPAYKDGEQLRDFVYVKDITNWMWEIATNPAAPSGIYNLGFGQARTWLDLARAVFANLNRPLSIDWIDVPENIRRQYQYFTLANTERLLSIPVSPPRWPLELGIHDYVKNYLSQTNPYLEFIPGAPRDG